MVELREIEKRQICRCDNCTRLFLVEDLDHQFPDIPDLTERLTPGGTVPAGECLEETCKSLCYLVDVADVDLLAEAKGLIEDFLVDAPGKDENGEFHPLVLKARALLELMKNGDE